MAGLLMLWLVMEEGCPKLVSAYVAFSSDSMPTIGLVKRLAERGLFVAIQLVKSLTLRFKKAGASPLTPMNIAGEENSRSDIPSRSFVSNLSWFCKNDTYQLKNINKIFPLTNQAYWTVFSPSNSVIMKVISELHVQHLEMGEWLQHKKSGKMLKIGVTLSDLWEWRLGYRMPCTSRNYVVSQTLQIAYAQTAFVKENNLQLEQSLRCSQPLARRSLWQTNKIPPRLKSKKL